MEGKIFRNLENRSAWAEQEKLKPKSFSLLVEGKFTRDELAVSLVAPGSSITHDSESEAAVNATWSQLLASGLKAWPNDTKPTRYRFVTAITEEDTLCVVLDPCVSYKDYAAGKAPEFRATFGKEYQPNPVGVNTVIIAKDAEGKDRMLLTLRSDAHDYKAGGYQVGTGGFMEIKKDSSPFDTAIREMKEESGIDPEECEELVCRGIVTEEGSASTNVIFETKTSLTVEEIIRRRKEKQMKRGLSAEEAENNLVFIPTNRIALQQWLLAPAHAAAGSGLISLILVGKEFVGRETDAEGNLVYDKEAWSKEMMHALAWREHEALDPDKQAALEDRDRARLAVKVGKKGDAPDDTRFIQ